MCVRKWKMWVTFYWLIKCWNWNKIKNKKIINVFSKKEMNLLNKNNMLNKNMCKEC